MVECQYHGELSLENYVKEKIKEEAKKDVVSTVHMFMHDGTHSWVSARSESSWSCQRCWREEWNIY